MTTATGRGTRTSARKRTSDSERDTKKPEIEGKTDYARWRLKDDDSRHTWHYLVDDDEVKKWPQSTAEKYYMNLPLVRPDPSLYLMRLLAGGGTLISFIIEPTRTPESDYSY